MNAAMISFDGGASFMSLKKVEVAWDEGWCELRYSKSHGLPWMEHIRRVRQSEIRLHIRATDDSAWVFTPREWVDGKWVTISRRRNSQPVGVLERDFNVRHYHGSWAQP